jgi:hypothetical protein
MCVAGIQSGPKMVDITELNLTEHETGIPARSGRGKSVAKLQSNNLVGPIREVRVEVGWTILIYSKGIW